MHFASRPGPPVFSLSPTRSVFSCRLICIALASSPKQQNNTRGIITPNLDKLANAGVILKNYYVQVPTLYPRSWGCVTSADKAGATAPKGSRLQFPAISGNL